MMQSPSRIWISAPGKELPEWVVERMLSPDIREGGRFTVEASDGEVEVQPGFAVFEAGEQFFACPPKQVQDKLKAVAGDHEAVVELEDKAATFRAQKLASKAACIAKARNADKPLKLKPIIGSPPAPQFVNVGDLEVDDTYQRSIEGGASRSLIRKIAEGWDWRLCLPLLVSRRQGQLYVIDGQHRLEAAVLRGDIQHLPVVVFDFDDPKAEAELFVAANRSRRQMSRLDDFHAAVVAGDPKAIEVNDIVVGAGLKIGRMMAWQYWKPGEVIFVSPIQRALKSRGKAIVHEALSVIARAFEGQVLTGVGAVFECLCALMHEREKAGEPVDTALMEAVLAEVGIPGWRAAVENAESGGERMELMRNALTQAYAEAAAQ